MLAARRCAALAEVAAQIRQAGGSAEVIAVDVTDDRSVEAAAERVLAGGPLDVLVNNAGTASQVPFLAQGMDRARAEIEVNYLGALRMARAFLPAMIAAGRGTIVNVSSLLGAIPAPASANYSATKAALNVWSHALRLPPHVATIVALDALGWHVVGLRPRPAGDAPPLWRVTIARYDESATMTLTEADPDAALEALARYARADAA